MQAASAAVPDYGRWDVFGGVGDKRCSGVASVVSVVRVVSVVSVVTVVSAVSVVSVASVVNVVKAWQGWTLAAYRAASPPHFTGCNSPAFP
jgi:hypothetical protein